MAIFIANENGDWWEYQPNSVMYVLDTDDLPEDVGSDTQGLAAADGH